MLKAVTPSTSAHRSQAGFSLPELLISVTVLLIISSAVTSALLQMTKSQSTIWNRTQLHAGVRSATELLQQEVGQAGRIALPGTATLAGAVAAIGSQTVGVKINGAVPATMSGFFVGEKLVIDSGGPTPCVVVSPCQESVVVTAVDTGAKQVTATFAYPHLGGAAVQALGGFGTGIVPPSPGYTNGSTATVLKLVGDINGDGKMVYIEYTCDPAPAPPALPAISPPGTGNLYRNLLPYDQTTAKLAATSSQVLLSNIQANPGGTACFTYMPSPLPVVGTDTYVLDVAITLTVQTQVIDPITKQFQTETKALLNVSPRNVFNVWQLASAGVTERVQPIPPTVAILLP
jgi:prepilin-type N-terminal cleavage/methylation domain-containing protein